MAERRPAPVSPAAILFAEALHSLPSRLRGVRFDLPQRLGLLLVSFFGRVAIALRSADFSAFHRIGRWFCLRAVELDFEGMLRLAQDTLDGNAPCLWDARCSLEDPVPGAIYKVAVLTSKSAAEMKARYGGL